MTYINISGYQFTPLTDLEVLQKSLKDYCADLNLKGTILLSIEGINVFLCGQRDRIDQIKSFLLTLGLPQIRFKESVSHTIPFKRMYVKIKPEISTMGVPEISPAIHPAPTLSPTIFKQWQDEGKPMVVLDTRNVYEIEIGKFKNAVDLSLQHFRSFPEAISQLPSEYKNTTIVTYCTGGIRCEKAAPLLISKGFKDVYQLEGGILNYFEQCGNAHFEGDCFVFDNRIALNSELEECPSS